MRLQRVCGHGRAGIDFPDLYLHSGWEREGIGYLWRTSKGTYLYAMAGNKVWSYEKREI